LRGLGGARAALRRLQVCAATCSHLQPSPMAPSLPAAHSGVPACASLNTGPPTHHTAGRSGHAVLLAARCLQQALPLHSCLLCKRGPWRRCTLLDHQAQEGASFFATEAPTTCTMFPRRPTCPGKHAGASSAVANCGQWASKSPGRMQQHAPGAPAALPSRPWPPSLPPACCRKELTGNNGAAPTTRMMVNHGAWWWAR